VRTLASVVRPGDCPLVEILSGKSWFLLRLKASYRVLAKRISCHVCGIVAASVCLITGVTVGCCFTSALSTMRPLSG
jgi:hypothetical protein